MVSLMLLDWQILESWIMLPVDEGHSNTYVLLVGDRLAQPFCTAAVANQLLRHALWASSSTAVNACHGISPIGPLGNVYRYVPLQPVWAGRGIGDDLGILHWETALGIMGWMHPIE